MITNDQRKLYWANLNQVFQSSRSSRPSFESDSLDQFRATFHTTHHLPLSTKDFTKQHFDTFLAACAAILQPANLKPQLRAFDQPKTRLLQKILVQQAALLRALDIATPNDYIAQICADKFHGRKPSALSGPRAGRTGVSPVPSGVSPALSGPSLSSLPSVESSSPEDRPHYSDLEKLLFTIANRIKDLRHQRGWTQHDINLAANLKCACAACRKSQNPLRRPVQKHHRAEIPIPIGELATATAESTNPF